MADARIVSAAYRHIAQLAPRLRESDVRELWQAAHEGPRDGLANAFDGSPLAWTVLRHETPVAMFGVAQAGAIGVPWLLGTPSMDALWLFLAKRSRKYVEAMQQRFPFLVNFVSAENIKSLRWLEWCGFSIAPAEPFGPEGALFHRIERRSI